MTSGRSSHQEASCSETEPSPPCSDCAPVSRRARIRRPSPRARPRADAADPQAAALRWSTTRLSIGNGLATDVNNQGQVVGYHSTNQGTRAFLWSNGTLQNLGTLGGGDSRAFAINEAGQVVGQSEHGDRRQHAFLWQNGTMQDLGPLGASFSHANRHRRQRPGGRLHRELDGTGSARLPVGERPDEAARGAGHRRQRRQQASTTRDASLDGTAISGSPRAFRWAAGVGDRPRHARGAMASANATVGGKIVGWSTKATGVQRAFVWQNGTMTGLGALGGGSSSANAINALGAHRRLEPAARQPASRGHLEGRRHVRHRRRRGRGRQQGRLGGRVRLDLLPRALASRRPIPRRLRARSRSARATS